MRLLSAAQMLARRFGSRIAAPCGAALTQRRHLDHERWYGHALEFDSWDYKFSNENPGWMKRTHKAPEELRDAMNAMGHLDFASCYEALIFDADRLNPHLNRKEFGNEIKFRLEKQANTVARGQQIVKSGQYASDLKIEDTMIARVADEEHVQAEMKYVKAIRANEVAEDNRLDILPGGSPNSLREKTRWSISSELHSLDRREIQLRLSAWLPEKYHILYFDDVQTVAANDEKARAEMLNVIDMVDKEHADEAKAAGFEDELKTAISDLKNEIDPTRHITSKAIADSTSLDQLEEWSRAVHEYNGDDRILQIYERAANLTGNKEHQDLLKEMRANLVFRRDI